MIKKEIKQPSLAQWNRTENCGIKLGTPHTALQSCPYYGDRNSMRFDIFTWNQENCP